MWIKYVDSLTKIVEYHSKKLYWERPYKMNKELHYTRLMIEEAEYLILALIDLDLDIPTDDLIKD
jgi:hypothetical protein